jgi:signal transduction histidine kinase
LHKLPNGQLIDFEVSLTLIPLAGKDYLFTQWRDISENKAMMHELKMAKLKAEESDRLKSIFLANMSHELRTPLNSVIGFSNLILDNQISREDRYYASIINNNGVQLLRIIEDLFDISMIEDGRFNVNRQNVSLDSGFFSSIYNTVKEDIEKSNKENVSLSFIPDPNQLSFELKTDRFRLMQVFLNLLRNSVKFTSFGKIIFGYKVKDDSIEFFVEDTGIGIPADKIEMITQPFRQVKEQYSMNNGGMGLGLSLCVQIVKLLEGELKIRSEEGKGSYISFALPKEVDIKHDDSDQKHTCIVEYLNGKKVLIAEDERDNYLLLKTFLSKNGAECVHASDGVDAVQKFNEHKNIDLVLMDIKMPRLDGFGAFKQIRKIDSRVKVIATTAFAMSGDEQKVYDLGFDSYIAKPIEFAKLEKVLLSVT